MYDYICRSSKLPPLTFVNLILYMTSIFFKVDVLSRACYANMWGLFLSFEISNIFYTHDQLISKQNMTPFQFYTGNILVHWLPLKYCHVSYIDRKTDALGIFISLIYCYLITEGSMDLSNVYVPLSRNQQISLWIVHSMTTILLPV